MIQQRSALCILFNANLMIRNNTMLIELFFDVMTIDNSTFTVCEQIVHKLNDGECSITLETWFLAQNIKHKTFNVFSSVPFSFHSTLDRRYYTYSSLFVFYRKCRRQGCWMLNKNKKAKKKYTIDIQDFSTK